MEDGHTLFDYDVRLNDTIQLLVRQSLALPSSSKERDSELSDSDSGYGVGQSESDKSSTHGEGAAEGDDKTVWEDTELGLYKVRWLCGHVTVAFWICPQPWQCLSLPAPYYTDSHTGLLGLFGDPLWAVLVALTSTAGIGADILNSFQ